MSRVEININHQVLRWAREEAGYDPIEIANKVGVGTEKYKLWEKTGKNIPIGKLKCIANSYKRQLAVFLLPSVPEKITRPKDYRNLSPVNSKLSKKVLDVIRDVTYFRETALELTTESYWQTRYQWIKEIEHNTDINIELRNLLNINIDEQLHWKNEGEAYRKWRASVEDRLGILVFQFSMPMNEVQGFCFADTVPYAIVVNSNHSVQGKIFTLFHELAHIIRHQSGICLFEKATEKQAEEWKCNAFAGRFLVPDNLVEQTGDLRAITQYAAKLKVSREVYLRRLKEEGKISDMNFFSLLDQIKVTYKEKKKGGVAISQKEKSKIKRGETFFNLIVEAMYKNQLSYSKAANALGLNVSTLMSEI